jgi:5-methyltetrahydropteroyltriglutamate--homocysteine methyltransferase
MARTAVLGFPRIGSDRELKTALEDYWGGRSSATALETTARDTRAANLRAGAEAGIDVLPVGDFALYDHVLDVAEMVTLIAERHGGAGRAAAPTRA